MPEKVQLLSPEGRRVKAIQALAEVPPLAAEFLRECNPVWRLILRDLVQDDATEDAILRVMQADWTIDRSAANR
ncbi:hypothetical protein [Streptomyces cucumeris]|uniref:hypothetical protein n=1 Tax=Streptomyces cucumeris TaxID=2962890 RepID=UPI0020C8BAD8|nr:hypothetical protein [Streptomyces sp. NEAU-Y11]MCP9209618.1 hypothetical protein [Streptomyces sp. NEAU-Y11]